MDIEKIKATLFFPIRDPYARKQLLIASLVMLAGIVVPIIPLFFLMGYGARIARQIVIEKKEPSMGEWDNWNEFLADGARIFGIRMIFSLPIIILGLIVLFLTAVTPALISIIDQQMARDLSPLMGLWIFLGIMIFTLIMLLSLPLQLFMGVAETHVAVKGSFSAGLKVKEWWPILRKGLGKFVMASLIIFVTSFVLNLVIQISAITIALLCMIPFVLFLYAAYISIILQTFYAQAYLQTQEENHATA